MKHGQKILGSKLIAILGCFALGFLTIESALGQARPCPPTLADSSAPNCSNDAEQDWLYRSTLPGVKWAHNFASDNEVTFWIWVGGVGDDPERRTAKGQAVTWDTSDYVSGGGSLKLLRKAGTAEPGVWWRPMSAMEDSGRGQPDIGYIDGTPTISPPNPDGGGRIGSWHSGNYGPASSGEWDGSEYYVQMRMKLDPVRRDDETQGGKIIYLTRTERSLVGQEVVTTYLSGSPHTFALYKAGSPRIVNEIDYVEHVYGEWFTVLYHIVPGDENQPNTIIEVWRALAGETSYTKIYQSLDEVIDYQDTYNKAWNAVLVTIYHNNIDLPEFTHQYDEIIFSTDFIPAPAN